MRIVNIKGNCPECNESLKKTLVGKYINKEKPKWYELSKHNVYYCNACQTKLKFRSQPLLIWVTFVLFSLGFWGLNYIPNLFGQIWAFVFMGLIIVCIYVLGLYSKKNAKLLKDV